MIYRPSQKKQAINFIEKQFEKKKWLKIDPISEKKTLNQNNYLWLVFTIIAFDTGNQKEDIYQYYLDKFPTFKEININEDIKSIKISLSQFTVKQASLFIDKIVIDARQEGFNIPDPGEKEALEAYNFYRQKGFL